MGSGELPVMCEHMVGGSPRVAWLLAPGFSLTHCSHGSS